MPGPILFLGQRTAAVLLAADEGYADGAATYALLARTARAAPAGVGGDVLMTALYLTLSHTEAATVRVTPVVDGIALEATDIVLGPAAERAVTAHEVGVSVPYVVGGVEVSRAGARGTWVQVQVESVGAFGDLTVEAVEVEYEVLRESKSAA